MKVKLAGPAHIVIKNNKIYSKYDLDIKSSWDEILIKAKESNSLDNTDTIEGGHNFNLFGMNINIGGNSVSNSCISVVNSGTIIQSNGNTITQGSIKPKYKTLKEQYDIETLGGVVLKGSGDIDVYETKISESFSAKVQGSGDIRLSKLQFNNIDATVQGSGDIVIKADADSVSLTVQGSGDIKYRGKYKNISQKVQGSGDISVGSLINL